MRFMKKSHVFLKRPNFRHETVLHFLVQLGFPGYNDLPQSHLDPTRMPNLEMIPFVFLLCHNPLFFCCDFQSSEENKTDSLSLSRRASRADWAIQRRSSYTRHVGKEDRFAEYLFKYLNEIDYIKSSVLLLT